MASKNVALYGLSHNVLCNRSMMNILLSNNNVFYSKGIDETIPEVSLALKRYGVQHGYNLWGFLFGLERQPLCPNRCFLAHRIH